MSGAPPESVAGRRKADLVSILAHDLKGPLMGVMANAQLLLDDPTLGRDQRSLVEDILSASDPMRRMILDIIDVSRAEDGALVPNVSSVALGEVVAAVFAQAGRIVTLRGQHLVRLAGIDAVRLDADSDLLRRVLENLIDNALRHAPRGSEIRIDATLHDTAATIEVVDEGVHIPDALLARVFDAAARVDLPPAARAGRGLGLAFCRLAVEAHGGRIHAENRSPQGCAFVVTLPRRAEAG